MGMLFRNNKTSILNVSYCVIVKLSNTTHTPMCSRAYSLKGGESEEGL